MTLLEKGRLALMKIIFSNTAYLQILLEVKKFCGIETGAILVGREVNGDYYVFESLDSGIHTQRSSIIFHRDNNYSEHLVDVVRAKYNNATAIGFWHRHPNNYNQFSGEDRAANIDMARVLDKNIVSGLINIYDNQVHCKFWQITLQDRYTQLEILIGDEYFPQGIKTYKNINLIAQQIVQQENNSLRQIHPSRHITSNSIASANRIANQEESSQLEEPRKKLVKKIFDKVGDIFSSKPSNAIEPNTNIDNPQANNPQNRILKKITYAIAILQNYYNISCKINSFPNELEHPDKLALRFINNIDNKHVDILLIEKAENTRYLDTSFGTNILDSSFRDGNLEAHFRTNSNANGYRECKSPGQLLGLILDILNFRYYG